MIFLVFFMGIIFKMDISNGEDKDIMKNVIVCREPSVLA